MNFHDMEFGDLIEHVEESIRALRLRAYREGYKQGRFDEKIKGSGSEQYQKQRRDEIVERAKRDIDELRDGDGLYEVLSGEDFGYACFADFVVNREKRTVVALLRGYQSGKVRARGIANCHPNDCFNAAIGRAIALRRALGLEVPDDYLNAPQPVEVRVGDIVESYSYRGKPFKTFKVVRISKEDGTTKLYDANSTGFVRYEPEIGDRIIDDSREDAEQEV